MRGGASDWQLDDKTARQMRKLGVPPEQLGAPRKPELTETIRVAAHLVDAVDLFSGLRSQWRAVSGARGRPVFTGLDYAAIEPTLRMLEIRPRKRRRLFEQLRTMEREALRAMSEQRS